MAETVTPAYMTTREVADLLGVGADKVTDWIGVGDLAAVNVAVASGGIRPRWRISRQALEAFLGSRQSQPAATSSPRQKRGRATEPSYY